MTKKTYPARFLLLLMTIVFFSLQGCNSAGGGEPTISVLSPPQGTTITAGETVEVIYLAEDANGITRVAMSIDGNPVSFEDAPAPQGQTALEGVLTWTAEEPGEYTLLLTAYNANDGSSAPAGVTIIVLEAQDVQNISTSDQESITARGEATITKTHASYDFAANEAREDYTGDLFVENGCAISLSAIYGGIYIYDSAEDLATVVIPNVNEFTTGCLELHVNGVYVFVRSDAPEDETIVFRVIALNNEEVRLEYLIRTNAPGDSQASTTDEPTEATPPEGSLSGTPLHLTANTWFDFDQGTIFVYDGGIHDVVLRNADMTEDGLIHLELRDETSASVWGVTEPSYANCSSASLSSDSIPLNGGDLAQGTYVCFQTGEGLFGYLQLENVFPDSETGDQVLDLRYTMWDSFGSERYPPPALHTFGMPMFMPDGTGKDLDFFIISQADDVSFTIAGDKIEVAPLGTASIALWGATFPTKDDCLSITMGTESIQVHKNDIQEIITEVSYFCYQTDQGRLGRILLEGADEDAEKLLMFYNTDIPQISFYYDTWE